MSKTQSPRDILWEALISLNRLIERAVAEQRYADVKEIAELADGVTALMRNRPEVPFSPEAASKQKVRKAIEKPVDHRRTRRPATSKDESKAPVPEDYPKFKRDENRLVKLGWSKKNKREYEHRVPREAVLRFIQHLVDTVSEEQVFEVESLLPVRNSAGEELPAYQIYVTLAWLRSVGAVEKKGRDGYVLRDASLSNVGINTYWGSLPIRSV